MRDISSDGAGRVHGGETQKYSKSKYTIDQMKTLLM